MLPKSQAFNSTNYLNISLNIPAFIDIFFLHVCGTLWIAGFLPVSMSYPTNRGNIFSGQRLWLFLFWALPSVELTALQLVTARMSEWMNEWMPHPLLSINNATKPKSWLSRFIWPKKSASYITTYWKTDWFPSEANLLFFFDLCTLGSLSDNMPSYRFNHMKWRPAVATSRHNKYSKTFHNPIISFLTQQ